MNLAFFEILADAAAPVPGADPMLSMMNSFFTLILPLGVVMWLVAIRPARKKEKELRDRIAALKTGDRVITLGGVHGVVTNVKDGPTLTLKVDDTCRLTVDKSAVVTVLAKEAA